MAGIFAVILLVPAVIRFSPYPALRKFKSHKISTRIFDANGELIQILALEDGVRREFTSLDEIPSEVKEALILAEDKRFYKHHGVDVQAVFRALISNAEERRTVSGASTITMQLARIISPRKKRNLSAKIIESLNALRLESRLSKDEILELYLNNIPFGFNVEGVTSASRSFFCKNLGELSADEIDILSKIPRRPQNYSDIAGRYAYPFNMPHYIQYLKSVPELGLFKTPEIHLPAALNVQKRCEELLLTKINAYADNRISNGAVLAIDIRTGAVIAWAGSGSFSDSEHGGQIDGVLVPNQPGSSMKPFLYALALENGYEPSTVLPDIPMEFGYDSLYVPMNFNNRYNGPIRFRVALASSLNIPAVYILNELGIEKYRSKLFDLGFESLRDQDTGLSLALGGGEVTLFELVQAFSVFPREGEWIPVTPLGINLEEKNSYFSVYESDTARLICSILSDSTARALGFGFSKVFETKFPAMFKTGTANQYQNITALGASGRYAVGVWMGNFSGEKKKRKTGSSIPATIVKEVLELLENDGKKSQQFNKPLNFHKEKICALSGLPAGPWCENTVLEYISDAVGLDEKCTWHSENGVVYPEIYSTWFNLRNREGSIEYGTEEFKIVSPRQNSVFSYDAAAEKNGLQKLTVEVSGGQESICEGFLDGEFVGISERPFEFGIPLSRGNHVFEVSCGKEKSFVLYSVK